MLLSYRIVMDRDEGVELAKRSACTTEMAIIADTGELVEFDHNGVARKVSDLDRSDRVRARVQYANGVRSMTIER